MQACQQALALNPNPPCRPGNDQVCERMVRPPLPPAVVCLCVRKPGNVFSCADVHKCTAIGSVPSTVNTPTLRMHSLATHTHMCTRPAQPHARVLARGLLCHHGRGAAKERGWREPHRGAPGGLPCHPMVCVCVCVCCMCVWVWVWATVPLNGVCVCVCECVCGLPCHPMGCVCVVCMYVCVCVCVVCVCVCVRVCVSPSPRCAQAYRLALRPSNLPATASAAVHCLPLAHRGQAPLRIPRLNSVAVSCQQCCHTPTFTHTHTLARVHTHVRTHTRAYALPSPATDSARRAWPLPATLPCPGTALCPPSHTHTRAHSAHIHTRTHTLAYALPSPAAASARRAWPLPATLPWPGTAICPPSHTHAHTLHTYTHMHAHTCIHPPLPCSGFCTPGMAIACHSALARHCHMPTLTHTRAHTHARTHTHAHTHTHTRVHLPLPCSGFCTPGMAIACHSALARHAAKRGSTTSSTSTSTSTSAGGCQQQCGAGHAHPNGCSSRVSSSGDCSSGGSSCSEGGGYSRSGPTAVEMRDALDGNLCRCTGYRPIVDACKVGLCEGAAWLGRVCLRMWL